MLEIVNAPAWEPLYSVTCSLCFALGTYPEVLQVLLLTLGWGWVFLCAENMCIAPSSASSWNLNPIAQWQKSLSRFQARPVLGLYLCEGPPTTFWVFIPAVSQALVPDLTQGGIPGVCPSPAHTRRRIFKWLPGMV